MGLPTAILRFLLAAALAMWLPLCLCDRAGGAEGGESRCCAGDTDRGCCDKSEREKPCEHDGGCLCGERDVYTGGSSDTHTPPAPLLLFVLTWPAPSAVSVEAQAFARSAHSVRAAPRPPTSLLRQHCALIV